MILKIRTGWDSEGNDLFKTLGGVQSVDDHGLCDPFDITPEACWYQLADDHTRPGERIFTESVPPRVITVTFDSGAKLTYAIVDAYLCNDSGATLGRYCGNWRAIPLDECAPSEGTKHALAEESDFEQKVSVSKWGKNLVITASGSADSDGMPGPGGLATKVEFGWDGSVFLTLGDRNHRIRVSREQLDEIHDGLRVLSLGLAPATDKE